jgi:hypothetical protein
LTLAAEYGIYSAAFKYRQEDFITAIHSQYLAKPLYDDSGHRQVGTAPLFDDNDDSIELETADLQGFVIASVQGRVTEQLNAYYSRAGDDDRSFAVWRVFEKGINGRYRLLLNINNRGGGIGINPLIGKSEWMETWALEAKGAVHYLVFGYHMPQDTAYYELIYATVKDPLALPGIYDKTSEQKLRFAVKKPQFIDIYPAEALQNRLMGKIGESEGDIRLEASDLYNMNDESVLFSIQPRDCSFPVQLRQAKDFHIYVYMFLALGVGVLCTRFILKSTKA